MVTTRTDKPKHRQPPYLPVERRMIAEAKKAVLESGAWLTATEVANAVDRPSSETSVQLDKWIKEGRLFAVQHGGTDRFPIFALDPNNDYQPATGLPQVLAVLRSKSAWGLAYWFSGVNSFLGGRRPQDLLMTEAEKVLAAAEDAVVGIQHG